MARFVLIHGAFGGGWIWGPLAEKLERAGHTVEAPDLPGGGDDPTPAQGVTLDSWTDRVSAALAARPEPAILVAHSMGGIPSIQAASRAPERIAALVFVSAVVPRTGQSLFDLTALPEAEGDLVGPNVVVAGDPAVATLPDEFSRPAFYGSCSDEIVDWAMKRQCPQPVAVFAQPASVDDGALEAIPIAYVFCRRDRAVPPALQRLMAEGVGCSRTFELDTDHVPQLSAVDELAEILGGVAV